MTENLLLREDGYPNAPKELSDGEIYAIPSRHHLLPINIGDKTFDVPIAVHLHIIGLSMRLEEAEKNAARWLAVRNIPDDQMGVPGVLCVSMPSSSHAGEKKGYHANGEDADRLADAAIAAALHEGGAE